MAQGVGVAVRSGAAPLLIGLRWASAHAAELPSDIPLPRWGLALASKVVLDEAFFTTEVVLARIASRGAAQRFGRELPRALEQYHREGWLGDPASYHRDPPVPRAVELEDRRSALVRYRHMRLPSDYEPNAGEPGRRRWMSYRANRIAHAWLLEHPGAPRPWLICIPGYRMGSPLVDFTGFRASWLHRALGLNVAIPVMPLHGPRREGRRGGDGFFTGDFIDTVHAQAQAVWDARRLARWLRERGAPALGVYGVSLGGYTAALLASLESGIDCVVAGVPATDFVRLLRSHMPDLLLRLAERAGFAMNEVGELLRVVSPLAIEPRVARSGRFVYAGLADRLATPDHARDLWHHWDRPRVAWYQGSHVSFLWEREVGEFLREAFGSSGLLR